MTYEEEKAYKKKFGELPPTFNIDNKEQLAFVDKQVKLALKGERGRISFYEIPGNEEESLKV